MATTLQKTIVADLVGRFPTKGITFGVYRIAFSGTYSPAGEIINLAADYTQLKFVTGRAVKPDLSLAVDFVFAIGPNGKAGKLFLFSGGAPFSGDYEGLTGFLAVFGVGV